MDCIQRCLTTDRQPPPVTGDVRPLATSAGASSSATPAPTTPRGVLPSARRQFAAANNGGSQHGDDGSDVPKPCIEPAEEEDAEADGAKPEGDGDVVDISPLLAPTPRTAKLEFRSCFAVLLLPDG